MLTNYFNIKKHLRLKAKMLVNRLAVWNDDHCADLQLSVYRFRA